MEKLKMHTPDLTQDHITRIRELFPNCVTEARDASGKLKLAVDFDQLKQELSDSIVEGPQERYHLNWPGKREGLSRWFVSIPVADFYFMAWGREPQHVALITDHGIIHSYSGVGKVVEHSLDERWRQRIAAAYRFPYFAGGM